MPIRQKLTARQTKIIEYLYHSGSNQPDAIARALGVPERDVKSDIRALQEMQYISGPPSLLSRAAAFVKEHESEITSEHYPSFIILAASIIESADERYLAEELDYDQDFVGTVGARLRNAKIWEGNAVSDIALNRWKGEEGGIAFLLDVNVAAGLMECLDGESDNPRYKMTTEGKRYIEAKRADKRC